MLTTCTQSVETDKRQRIYENGAPVGEVHPAGTGGGLQVNPCQDAKSPFLPAPNHVLLSRVFRATQGLNIMAAKANTSTASTNSNRPVTLKHLAATLAEEHQMTKRAGEALLGDLVELITKHLKKGERIRISGFGILQVRKRAARMGRNPATGEAIKIKASKKVAFRPSKELKLAV
jgi:DNA-binding protein HU-beta